MKAALFLSQVFDKIISVVTSVPHIGVILSNILYSYIHKTYHYHHDHFFNSLTLLKGLLLSSQ